MRRVYLLSKRSVILGCSLSVAVFTVPTIAFAAETISYSYDVHGRVVKVQHSGGTNASTKIEYIYDKADNREQVKVTNSPNAPPP